MRVYRDHHHRDLSAASIVAIGNFDGVHRGHQALLARARERAGDDMDVAVVSFEPLPRAWFDSANAPPRLTGPAQKLRLLREAGVDLAWLLRFNGALAGMSARGFVEQVLAGGLNARLVIVGEDFRFGKGRQGDLTMLRELGTEFGFDVAPVGDVTDGELRISSTAIRDVLAKGDFERARQLLGRPFSITGHVIRGQQLGRTLGYPTANIRPWKGSIPLQGVYAVRARVVPGDAGQLCSDEAELAGSWQDGVASVGTRPAVGGGETLLEVHLFDFDGDLYGQRLETRFIARLRGEEDFASLDALVVKMNNDASAARSLLAAATLE